MSDFHVSERRTCRVRGQNRAVQRHTPITRDDEDALTERIIEPGSPWENGYVERLNGKLRDELLDREVFETPLEARVLIERLT